MSINDEDTVRAPDQIYTDRLISSSISNNIHTSSNTNDEEYDTIIQQSLMSYIAEEHARNKHILDMARFYEQEQRIKEEYEKKKLEIKMEKKVALEKLKVERTKLLQPLQQTITYVFNENTKKLINLGIYRYIELNTNEILLDDHIYNDLIGFLMSGKHRLKKEYVDEINSIITSTINYHINNIDINKTNNNNNDTDEIDTDDNYQYQTDDDN